MGLLGHACLAAAGTEPALAANSSAAGGLLPLDSPNASLPEVVAVERQSSHLRGSSADYCYEQIHLRVGPNKPSHMMCYNTCHQFSDTANCVMVSSGGGPFECERWCSNFPNCEYVCECWQRKC